MTERCIECNESVEWGSGNYVNRVPADNGIKSGFKCADCCGIDCERCGEMIGLDEDITPDRCGLEDFDDGAHFIHYECMTAHEKQLMEDYE